jgi:hypothetical protein
MAKVVCVRSQTVLGEQESWDALFEIKLSRSFSK